VLINTKQVPTCKIGLFWNTGALAFGQLPFLTPPITHTQVYWVNFQRLKSLSRGSCLQTDWNNDEQTYTLSAVHGCLLPSDTSDSRCSGSDALILAALFSVQMTQ